MTGGEYLHAFAIGFAGVFGGRLAWATFDACAERVGRLFR